jgi:hypothetical protein
LLAVVKFKALLKMPATQVGLLVKVPSLPYSPESTVMVPVPSSKCHQSARGTRSGKPPLPKPKFRDRSV